MLCVFDSGKIAFFLNKFNRIKSNTGKFDLNDL